MADPAQQAMDEAAGIEAALLSDALLGGGLPPAPADAAFGSYDALPRFYMFTLKAYAYLQLRLGDTGEGRDAVLKLLELDPADRINAGLLLDVLQRAGRDDD